MLPFEMNRFAPLRTHSSPSSRAGVGGVGGAAPPPRPAGGPRPDPPPPPTVLPRDGRPEEPEVLHLVVERPRDLAPLLPLPHVRDELLVDELPPGLLGEPLLLGQAEVHCGPPSPAGTGGPP